MTERVLPPPDSPDSRSPAVTPPAGASTTIGVFVLLLLAGWMLILRKIGNGNVYAYLGPYALVVLGVCELIRRHARLDVSAASAPGTPAASHGARDLLVGLGVGVVMTLGTYVAYPIVSRVVPSLASHVEDLYAAARTETFAAALAWTVVVLIAEEVLWRGLFFEVIARRLSPAIAGALSLGAYVVVELGSRSWVLALAALVCGAFWTAERIATRSLVAPIVSHAIWTVVILHVHPVIPP